VFNPVQFYTYGYMNTAFEKPIMNFCSFFHPTDEVSRAPIIRLKMTWRNAMTALRRSSSLLSFFCIGGLLLHLRVWSVDQSLLRSVIDVRGEVVKPSHEPIHLVYASDDPSIAGVEASIRSVMCHASEPVIFHYIGDSPLESLPEVNYYNLTKVAKKYYLEEFTNPHERHEANVQGLNTNLANYARFVIHELLPDQSKALWVDVDTVIRCDIVPMVRNALSESPHVIAAVPSARIGPKGFKNSLKKKLKIKRGFNAGVYVVDLDRWRSQNVTKQVRKWTLENRKKRLYKLGSQAPMTLVFHDNFEYMSPKWNTKVSHVDNPDKRDDAENACLLHWSGPNKPWHKDGIHKDLWVPCPQEEAST